MYLTTTVNPHDAGNQLGAGEEASAAPDHHRQVRGRGIAAIWGRG
ncbi:MAG TPA: hypothetical protein VEK76_08655 [Candidatus Binatia bacterium]|nr:hypothetical protein [Candidatus Binatia bacterium]